MKFEIDLNDDEMIALDQICKFFGYERKAGLLWLLRDQFEFGSNSIPPLLKSLPHAAFR